MKWLLITLCLVGCGGKECPGPPVAEGISVQAISNQDPLMDNHCAWVLTDSKRHITCYYFGCGPYTVSCVLTPDLSPH